MTLTPRAAANVTRHEFPPHGRFVSEADYAALEAQHEELVEALKTTTRNLHRFLAASRVSSLPYPLTGENQRDSKSAIDCARALLARIEGKGVGNG